MTAAIDWALCITLFNSCAFGNSSRVTVSSQELNALIIYAAAVHEENMLSLFGYQLPIALQRLPAIAGEGNWAIYPGYEKSLNGFKHVTNDVQQHLIRSRKFTYSLKLDSNQRPQCWWNNEVVCSACPRWCTDWIPSSTLAWISTHSSVITRTCTFALDSSRRISHKRSR